MYERAAAPSTRPAGARNQRRIQRWVLEIAICVAAALAAPCAHAQVDTAQARAAFRQGAKAYNEADYRRAIALFQQAYQLDPHPALIYNVGQAYEKLGNVPAALRSFRKYLRLAPDARDRATVEAKIRNLEQRLRASGVQQVTVLSRPLGATLSVDGKPLGETPWTGELAPGRHRAVLRLVGHPDTTRDFLLPPDRAIDLDVALLDAQARAAGPAHAPAPPPDATPQRPRSEPMHDRGPAVLSRVHPWTWAALGAGVATLAGSAGFELARRSAESDARSAQDQLAYQKDYDTMKSRQTAARVLLGVGGALTVAGGVLLYLDLSPKKEHGAAVGFGCGARFCGVSTRGRF